jgi:hypothetical protein
VILDRGKEGQPSQRKSLRSTAMVIMGGDTEDSKLHSTAGEASPHVAAATVGRSQEKNDVRHLWCTLCLS